MSEEGGLTDPTPIRDKIDAQVGELFDFNQKVATVLRQQAKEFEQLAGFFGQQQTRAYEIASLIVELAAVAAENAGDILMAEFGIRLGPDADDDDDEDGEEIDE